MQIIAAAVAISLAVGQPVPGSDPGNTAQDSPAPASPAERTASDDIRRLVTVGQRVTIADDQGRQLEGRIGALEPDRLTLVSRRDSTDVPYEGIVRIDRPHDGLGNGALWGFGVGAGLGFAMVLDEAFSDCEPGAFFSCGDPHPAAYVVVPAIIGGLGAAIGVGVDALIRREPNIYRRGSTTAALAVVPRLGRGFAGAAVSVTW